MAYHLNLVFTPEQEALIREIVAEAARAAPAIKVVESDACAATAGAVARASLVLIDGLAAGISPALPQFPCETPPSLPDLHRNA